MLKKVKQQQQQQTKKLVELGYSGTRVLEKGVGRGRRRSVVAVVVVAVVVVVVVVLFDLNVAVNKIIGHMKL